MSHNEIISGVGIAMVEIARIERVLQRRPDSLRRWFSAAELERAAHRARPAEELAGRYACKIAVRESLRARPGHTRLSEILTGNDSLGKPYVALQGQLWKEIQEAIGGAPSIEVSVTHSRGYAAAIAVVAGGGASNGQGRE